MSFRPGVDEIAAVNNEIWSRISEPGSNEYRNVPDESKTK